MIGQILLAAGTILALIWIVYVYNGYIGMPLEYWTAWSLQANRIVVELIWLLIIITLFLFGIKSTKQTKET